MELSSKSNSSSQIFLFAYSIYLISGIFEYTAMQIPRNFLNITRIIVICIILFKIFYYDKVTYKWIVSFLCLFLLSIITYIKSDSAMLLYTVILVYGANGIKFEYILKFFRNISTVIIILITISAFMGVLPNLVFFSSNGAKRMAMGFYYPTDYVAFLDYIIWADMYILLSEKKEIFKKSILYIFVAVLTYLFCNSRLGSSMILISVLFLWYTKLMENRKIHKFSKYIYTHIYTISALVTVILVYLYTENPNNPILGKLDTFFNYRLYYSKLGVIRYGYSLFGQHIEMVTTTNSTVADYLKSNYFYIDSSYMAIILTYGIVTMFILCLAFSKAIKRDLKAGNLYSVIILFLVSIDSLIGQQLLNPVYNPFLFLALSSFYTTRNESQMFSNI